VAESFDITYAKIDSSLELSQQLKSVIGMGGPVLCEIMGLENQGYISLSHARNSKNRFVVRPLEDQAPYISRELFLNEMVIEPIDQ
jgi:acetolactate synthase-1/2/3 large subunit